MALLSAERRSVELAAPLQIRNTAFDQYRVVLRRGQLTLLCSAPSVGKSLLARNVAAKSGEVRTLYFSADSDEYTVRTSVLGSLTGQLLEEVEYHLANDPGGKWREYYLGILRRADSVEWVFSPNINLDYIILKLQAYAEIYGDYPDLTVIDNVGDMVTEEDEEYAELRRIVRELRRIGRRHETHILGLVHAKGPYENGMKPIDLGALLGNLGKVPENVFGLHWTDYSGQHVAMTLPKLRGGKRGATIPLDIDYATGSVGGFY